MAKLNPEQLAARLQKSLDEGRNFYDIQDVIAKVKSGEWQWHENGSGHCITQVSVNKKGQKILQGKFIFGNLEDVMAMSDRIDDFARSEGCVEFTMDGRFGWSKVLKKYGWQVAGVIMSKEL